MNITILDRHAPLVLLWGPCYVGKTMALKRLFDFLRGKGYGIQCDNVFLPADFHDEIVKYFENLVAEVPFATYLPMLSKVYNCCGRTICQFVDFPGQDCFNNLTNEKYIYPKYINDLLLGPNRKIIVIFIELNGLDQNVRLSYVENIIRLSHVFLSRRDKIIFVVPKIDTLSFLTNNRRQLFALANELYSTLFKHFTTRNPIIRFFKPYKFDFIPFSSGRNIIGSNGNAYYVQGNETFPQKLWQAIIKAL